MNTKALLRHHARKLFAQRGYDGVSMRDIATSVGVRQSAIYNHFASKQDLLVDLMVTHMDRVLSELRAELSRSQNQSAADRLEAFARFHVTYHIDQSDDVFLAYMELRSLADDGRAKVMALRDAYEDELRAILRDGEADGAFRIGPVPVMARALLAMLTGVTVWFREGGGLSRADVAQTYVDAALQAVGLVRAGR